MAPDWVTYYFAFLFAQTGNFPSAFERQEAALKNKPVVNFDELQAETPLTPLRSLPQWKPLLKNPSRIRLPIEPPIRALFIFYTPLAMCGRYSFAPKSKQVEAQLRDVPRPADFKISFNIAPTHQAYVIANDAPGILQTMEWGLVPHWSADGKNSGRLINARAEGIGDKPSFRDPVRQRRCLVPADSFYEWRTEPGGRKAPYRILPENGDLLFMAGIWDEWRRGTEIKRTFSIITTTPSREVSALHNRMPALLTNAEMQKTWLDPMPLDAALAMLHPAPDGMLALYRVSEKLNNPGYDEADLHVEVPGLPTLF